jgi:hypothetical protein
MEGLRDAVARARGKVGGEGRLVAWAAGLVLGAFVLLAASAPVALAAPAWASTALGWLAFALLAAGCGVGVRALTRLARGEPVENGVAARLEATVASVFGDAEDAGLRALGPRAAADVLTGTVAGRPCAAARDAKGGRTHALVRARAPFPTTLLIAPVGAPWPHALPADGALVTLWTPKDSGVDAWAGDREAGARLLRALDPALRLAGAGGEMPWIGLRGRSASLLFTRADVASALVVAAEVARALADPGEAPPEPPA